MEKAEITRLIYSFNAIKSYFETTKKYMPQIAKLVIFIEEVIPLLNMIHSNLHLSTSLIPTASEKLDKVTSATEMATNEVMNIVDNVIERLTKMSSIIGEIDENIDNDAASASIKEKTALITEQIDGSQEDLFSIMNALQFQDITTQQINSISSVIDNVQLKLAELLQGFDGETVQTPKKRSHAFDEHAEFNFSVSSDAQRLADEFLKIQQQTKDVETVLAENGGLESEEIIFGEDGQPDISAIMSELGNPQPGLTEKDDDEPDIIFGEDGQPDISAILGQLNSDKENNNG